MAINPKEKKISMI